MQANSKILSVCLHAHSVMSDSATPWTVACQAALSMGFSCQEYWSGWVAYHIIGLAKKFPLIFPCYRKPKQTSWPTQ